MIDLTEKGLMVVRNEVHFIEEVEALDINRRWKRFFIVVNKPRCDVRVVSRRWDSLGWKHHVDIQSSKDGKVFVGAILGVDEETPSLASGNTNILSPDISWLNIHSIDFHSRKGMAIKVKCVTGKVTDIHNMDKICFARLYGN